MFDVHFFRKLVILHNTKDWRKDMPTPASQMALDGLRNPDVDVSPEDTAGDDEDHAPETDGHKAAEPKRRMKKDEIGAECAKEDVCLEPVLQFSVSA